MNYDSIDNTAILSTSLPNDIRYAIHTNNVPELKQALEAWNPFVTVPHNEEIQIRALNNIGKVVEKICNCEFDPPNPDVLIKKYKDGKAFYNHVCENCDIRKSCDAYKNLRKSSNATEGFLE